MPSDVRLESIASTKALLASAKNTNPFAENLLYVGTAGDKEDEHEFPGWELRTMDKLPGVGADVVGDITEPPQAAQGWADVVVILQTVEHIPNLFDLPTGVKRALRPRGMVLIDCPLHYPYHGTPGFGDFWRITKDGFAILFPPEEWELLGLVEGKVNTACLFRWRN